MINNINDSVINNQINKQKELSLVGKANSNKAKLYAVNNASYDKTDISDTAINLYQREKDIDKYSKMVMDSLNSPDNTGELEEIANLVNSGKYGISDEDLANALFSNEDFTNVLF